MLKINEEINGILVDANFSKGLNCIDLGMSGTGKSFLLSLIKAYCLKNSIYFKSFDYNSSTDDIISVLKGSEENISVIMLDNADLYMTKELVSVLCNYSNAVVIVSIKKRLMLDSSYKLIKLVYTSNNIICKEV